jgi:hypothetical protein
MKPVCAKFVPRLLTDDQREQHQTKFDEDTIGHPEKGVRKMFPTVAAKLGKVCSCGRELC